MYNEDMTPAFMIKGRNNVCYVFKGSVKAKQKLCEIAVYLYNIINTPLKQEEIQSIYNNEYFYFSDTRIEILNCWLGD